MLEVVEHGLSPNPAFTLSLSSRQLNNAIALYPDVEKLVQPEAEALCKLYKPKTPMESTLEPTPRPWENKRPW